MDRFMQGISQMVNAVSGLADTFSQVPGVSFFNRFRKIGGSLETYCRVYPMGLTRFTSTSSPNPIPYLDFLDSTQDTPAITNKGTVIQARLEPLLSGTDAAEELANLMEGRINKQAQGQVGALLPEQQDITKRLLKEYAKQAHARNKEAIQKWLDTNPAAFNAVSKTVYRSDITAVPEALRNARQVLKQNVTREMDGSQASIPAWGFYGDTSIPLRDQKLKDANIFVFPITRHFMFLNPVSSLTDSTFRNRPYSDDILKIPVKIGPVQKGFRVTKQYIAPNQNRGKAQVDVQSPVWLKLGNSIVRGPFQSSQTFEHDDCRGVFLGVGCTRGGSAKISAILQSATVLEMSVFATSTGTNFPNSSVKSNIPMASAMTVEFFNPAVRGNTQTITISITGTRTNQNGPGVLVGRHTAGFGCSITNSQGAGIGDGGALGMGTTTKTLTLSGGISGICGIDAGGDGPGSSSVKVKIELKSY